MVWATPKMLWATACRREEGNYETERTVGTFMVFSLAEGNLRTLCSRCARARPFELLSVVNILSRVLIK